MKETGTKVKDVMEKNPEMISPDATVMDACQRMRDVDCGCLPVGTADEPEGMITDRDIVIRTICEGNDPAIAIVRDYMTTDLRRCKESDSVKDAAEHMNKYNVSRLAVEDDEGRITGILSFGHILRSDLDDAEITETVCCATGKKAA